MITIEELQTTDKKVAYVVMRDYLSGKFRSCQQSVATLRANASMKIEEAEAQGKEPPAQFEDWFFDRGDCAEYVIEKDKEERK